jgi:hypothetical protein
MVAMAEMVALVAMADTTAQTTFDSSALISPLYCERRIPG